MGKVRPLTQLPRRLGVHSENSRPPPRRGPKAWRSPKSFLSPIWLPGGLALSPLEGPTWGGGWWVGLGFCLFPEPLLSLEAPRTGRPGSLGEGAPGQAVWRRIRAEEGAPPGDASASASRRREIGRGGRPKLRGRGRPSGPGTHPGGPACPALCLRPHRPADTPAGRHPSPPGRQKPPLPRTQASRRSLTSA